jgi:hypothetical protein
MERRSRLTPATHTPRITLARARSYPIDSHFTACIRSTNAENLRRITADYKNRAEHYCSPGAEEVYSRDYPVGTIPLNYLINGDGIVVDGWIGYLEGHARVNSALRTLGVGGARSEP